MVFYKGLLNPKPLSDVYKFAVKASIHLVAEFLHFKLFEIISSLIELKVYTSFCL